MKRVSFRFLPLLAVLGLAAVIAMVAGCGKQSSLVTAPDPSTQGAGVMGLIKASPFELNRAMQVQEAHTPAFLRMQGVVGTAITADAAGKPAIMILTESAMGARLPQTLEGYTVIENVTGKLHAYRGGAGSGHTAKQTPPIQLGTGAV